MDPLDPVILTWATPHVLDLDEVAVDGAGRLDLSRDGIGHLPLPVVVRVSVDAVMPAGAEPMLLLLDAGGAGRVTVDGAEVGRFGGTMHWRAVDRVALPVSAFDDGRMDLVVEFTGAPQHWPFEGAWLGSLAVADRADAELVQVPLLAATGATFTVYLVMTLFGAMHVGLARGLRDPLVLQFGMALLLFGGIRAVHGAWALGLLPLVPLESLAHDAFSTAGLWLVQISALELLAPEWTRLRRYGPPVIAIGIGFGQVLPAPSFMVCSLLLAVMLLASLALAAKRRRVVATPIALGLVPVALSIAVGAVAQAGVAGPWASLDLPVYLAALVSLPLGMVGGLAARLIRAGAAADQFVPREYLAAIGAAELADAKAGTRVERELTVLFTDVRGFTGLSERLPPSELAAVVDRVLSAQAECIVRNGGFVDKYIGDAVMALFPVGTHPARAAVSCVEAVRSLGLGVSIGVGVHHGTVQIGVVGSTRRLACTALGDAVNLASRVEGYTRELGAGALATSEVPVADTPSRDVGRVVVKGRSAAVMLRELGTPAPDGWDAAMAAVGDRRFAEAAERFASWPDDPVARVWATRSREAATSDPTWDGVTRLTGK